LKNNDLEIIERYIKGVASENEKDYVESLFIKGEDNQLLKQSLEKDWEISLVKSGQSEVNLNYLLDRIHHMIQNNANLRKQKPLNKLLQIYMKVAAIILFPLMAAGALTYSYLENRNKSIVDSQVESTIYAPFGARVSFVLPDSTRGMLNSGSSLTYYLPFKSNRQVKMEGEGWFEVKRDEHHPFKINTGSSTVTVLGTSFNLSAYPAENYVEVVLQYGQVEFRNNEGNGKVLVFPSERLIFQDGNISKSIADPEKYNAWTEGNLVFRSDPMTEVARRIERWYNVKVKLGDKALEKYSFRATFQDDKLEDVLRYLSLTSPIRYTITPRQLLDDGTFEKEIVSIFLKK
jgi:transmembrane sensor